MWSPEEPSKIFAMTKTVVPDIKTHAIPTMLQVQRGPNAVVEYLLKEVPKLLD